MNCFVFFYDNNVFQTTKAKLHLSPDSAIHAFNYADHNYNKKGLKTSVFYNLDDRLYVGLGYGFTKYKWRRNPFATKQFIGLNYSISQNAIGAIYTALYPNITGNWDLSLSVNYDAVRWTNFFGLGNKSVLATNDKRFYRRHKFVWFHDSPT